MERHRRDIQRVRVRMGGYMEMGGYKREREMEDRERELEF